MPYRVLLRHSKTFIYQGLSKYRAQNKHKEKNFVWKIIPIFRTYLN